MRLVLKIRAAGYRHMPCAGSTGMQNRPEAVHMQKKYRNLLEHRLPYHNACDHLGVAAVEDTHGHDHGAHREEACIVYVEQDGGHAKGCKTQWAGIGEFLFHGTGYS